MGKIILVRGLPGSGKSTYAKTLVHDFVVFEADKFFERSGSYVFNPADLPKAHLNCFLCAYEELRDCGTGGTIVVANTFSQKWEMQQYITWASLDGHEIEVHKCVGPWQSIHNVPPEAVERMAARWEDFEGEIVVQPPIE